MKLFFTVPYSEYRSEMVQLDCSDKNAERIEKYLQDKCGEDPLFKFVPLPEELLKKGEK